MSRDLRDDRLILTPAFQVVTEVVAAAAEVDDLPSPETAQSRPEPDPMLYLVEDDWEDAVWAEPGAAIAGTDPGLDAKDALDFPGNQDAPGDAAQTDGMEQSEGTLGDGDPDVDPDPDLDRADGGGADSVVPFPQFAEARAALIGEAEVVAAGLGPMSGPVSGLTDADGNPVTVIDEAALNDIVRSLIREELQGILGEKITQNVRKLVRAEINRALTARSLD